MISSRYLRLSSAMVSRRFAFLRCQLRSILATHRGIAASGDLGFCGWFGGRLRSSDRLNSSLASVMVARRLLVLHDDARMGHSCNVLPGWDRDVPEPLGR
jgi:hypothetical protein